MIHLLIVFLIICIIFGVVWWALSLIPIPAPFAWVPQVILALIFVLVLAGVLVPLANAPLRL